MSVTKWEDFLKALRAFRSREVIAVCLGTTRWVTSLGVDLGDVLHSCSFIRGRGDRGRVLEDSGIVFNTYDT